MIGNVAQVEQALRVHPHATVLAVDGFPKLGDRRRLISASSKTIQSRYLRQQGLRASNSKPDCDTSHMN